MKKQVDKTKLLTVAVITILCLIFVVGFIYGLNSVLAMEGADPPVVNEPPATPAPASAQEAVDYLYRVVDLAVAGKPKAESKDEFNIDGDHLDETLQIEGSPAIRAAARFAYEDVLDLLEESFDRKQADYFAGIEDVLLRPDVTADEIKAFTCDYIEFICPSCGETSAEPQDHCEACGGVFPYNERWKDDYTITLTLKEEDDDIVEKCFRQRSPEEIAALTADAIDGKMTISSTEVTYDELSIVFRVDRRTDELKELSYRKLMTVRADFGFIGDYAAVEGGSAAFELEELNKYILTWPSLKLSASTMAIEPGTDNNLLATLTCSDPTRHTVTWTSSDESVVRVDDEGYLKGGKHRVAEGKSAIITASFEFGGKTYSDSCEVFVRYPVESIALSKRKATVKAGDSLNLTVKFSPKKATVQTVTWYTENEAVAKVEKDGTIRAIAPGKTKVYCLSDDGYFKSSCEVTVK